MIALINVVLVQSTRWARHSFWRRLVVATAVFAAACAGAGVLVSSVVWFLFWIFGEAGDIGAAVAIMAVLCVVFGFLSALDADGWD